MIKQDVLDHWRQINTNFEGCVDYMYPDIKGLVTTGMGNLIDPLPLALELPWHRRDGSSCMMEEVEAEWRVMHGNDHLAKAGAKAAFAQSTLCLSDEALTGLIGKRLFDDAEILQKNAAFSDFADWPADAQCGLLSMAWAMGPGFGPAWPHFSTACSARNWGLAAEQCVMDATHNPGLVPRNQFNQACFRAAQHPSDPDRLTIALG